MGWEGRNRGVHGLGLLVMDLAGRRKVEHLPFHPVSKVTAGSKADRLQCLRSEQGPRGSRAAMPTHFFSECNQTACHAN